MRAEYRPPTRRGRGRRERGHRVLPRQPRLGGAGRWRIALTHLVSGIALCITIIGIPFGIADFKLIPVALLPLGKQLVDLP
ncbi:hypothetical protein RCH16_001232 [Cryobacterium sp. MP_M5]|uniref:YccF domain-containing protein n=1 Tax=unclassified Cryobacterium TaxID=2649013 RepID=UPI001A227680|nr:hypothetical protein [Cryobacterium sp. MP_M3]MEC5176233.1 hypothetical protein [Cryobacterium sp. MP_M5]